MLSCAPQSFCRQPFTFSWRWHYVILPSPIFIWYSLTLSSPVSINIKHIPIDSCLVYLAVSPTSQLIVYPETKVATALTCCAAGNPPITFFFFSETNWDVIQFTFPLDWLPNHIIVVPIILHFTPLIPLNKPFPFLYFSVESGTSIPWSCVMWLTKKTTASSCWYHHMIFYWQANTYTGESLFTKVQVNFYFYFIFIYYTWLSVGAAPHFRHIQFFQLLTI